MIAGQKEFGFYNLPPMENSLQNREVRESIKWKLEAIAQCTFFLCGEDELELEKEVEEEYGMRIEDYDVEKAYSSYYNDLVDEISLYNYNLVESDSSFSPLRLVVDEDAMSLVNQEAGFCIFRIV